MARSMTEPQRNAPDKRDRGRRRLTDSDARLDPGALAFANPDAPSSALATNGKHALASGPDVRGGRQALAHECFLRECSSAGRRRFDPAGSRVRPRAGAGGRCPSEIAFVAGAAAGSRVQGRRFDSAGRRPRATAPPRTRAPETARPWSPPRGRNGATIALKVRLVRCGANSDG
jgi:hypothetical protein